MARNTLAFTAVTSFALLAVALLALGWLLSRPTDVDRIAYRQYHRMVVLDPTRAGLYTKAYNLYVGVTRANAMHYAVHALAARVADVTGHAKAAEVQRYRVGFHRPSPSGALAGVLAAWHAVLRSAGRIVSW